MCSWRSRTPHFTAASYAESGIGSQAPNTIWSRSASGTKSRISGIRFSVRLPSRIVPIWVSDPIGEAEPRRACSTPAISVEATAPSPTRSTPSLPSAGAISWGWLSVKSLASKTIPFCRASDISGPCHCAGTRPVLAQCSMVDCRLPSRLARAVCPPKRAIMRSAAFLRPVDCIGASVTKKSLDCTPGMRSPARRYWAAAR